jgi:hypothetical protein
LRTVDGWITKRNMQLGSFVQPGMSLFSNHYAAGVGRFFESWSYCAAVSLGPGRNSWTTSSSTGCGFFDGVEIVWESRQTWIFEARSPIG